MVKIVKRVVVAVAILIGLGVLLNFYVVGDLEDNVKVEEFKEVIHNSSSSKEEGVDWSKFTKDTVAFLEIPGVVELPVVQGKDNDYYLHRGLSGKWKYSGTLFLDSNNEKDFSDDNSVVYGHNMANGTMFGKLKKFKEKSWSKKHSRFYLWVREGNKKLTYKVGRVVVVKPGSSLYRLSFSSEEDREDWLKSEGLWGNTLKGERVVTLSTCTRWGTLRLLVQGELEREG